MNNRRKQFLVIFIFAVICNLITDFYANVFGINVSGNSISVFVYHMLWAIQGAGWMMIGDWIND